MKGKSVLLKNDKYLKPKRSVAKVSFGERLARGNSRDDNGRSSVKYIEEQRDCEKKGGLRFL